MAKVSSRMLVGRRIWTVEAGRWRVSARLGRYTMGVQRDSPTAFCVALPWIAFTVFRTTARQMRRQGA